MKFIRPKLILTVLAFGLMASFQNCNKTSFTSTPEQSQQASSTPTETQTPTTVTTLPVTRTTLAQPSTTTTVPNSQPPAVYSTCESKTLIVACPDNAVNCTCTATLPGGSFQEGLWISSPTPDRTKNGTGPNCKYLVPDGNDNAAHSGTVVSPDIGTCTNYCSVMAKCLNGQWQQAKSTW